MDIRLKSAVKRSYLILAISANIVDVNAYYSTIAIGDSLDPILNKLLREFSNMITLMYIK